MNHEEIIRILCGLRNLGDRFENIQSSFTYTLFERKFEMTFRRISGRIVEFEMRDVGAEDEKD